MDVVNAILLVEGCTRLGINVKDLLSWNTIFTSMEKSSSLFNSHMIYRGLSCLRKLGGDNADSQKFLKLLWDRVEQTKIQMEDFDICPSIYSMQTFSSTTSPIRNFLAYFATALDESMEPIQSKTLCSAIL